MGPQPNHKRRRTFSAWQRTASAATGVPPSMDSIAANPWFARTTPSLSTTPVCNPMLAAGKTAPKMMIVFPAFVKKMASAHFPVWEESEKYFQGFYIHSTKYFLHIKNTITYFE